jgi:O-antigen/teichoic acid export membrane protein
MERLSFDKLEFAGAGHSLITGRTSNRCQDISFAAAMSSIDATTPDPRTMTLANKAVDDPTGAAADPAANQPNRRRIAANFVTLASTSVVGLIVTIVISIYVRRALGPAAIGEVSWALAAVSYLGVLVNPGLTTVGQRELAKTPGRGQELLALILTLQTVLAVVAYGLVVAIAALDLRGPAVNILLLIQGVTLFVTAWNTGWVLQANERMVAPSIAALVFNALQLPALLLLIHQPEDLYLYAILSLPFPLLGVIYNLWYLGRTALASPMQLRPRLAGALGLLREAWPLALTQSAVLIYFNSGTIILGFTDGDDAVGQYATAYRLMMVAAVITASLWNAYFPALARAHDSPATATLLSREYVGLLAWMGLPIAALGWACGRHVVELMYGPAFAAAGPYFEWLCLSIAITFLNYGLVAILVPWGHSSLQFKITAAGAAINLTVNLIAIPVWGAWGAVAGTLVAEAAVFGVGLLARRRYGIFWHPILPIVAPPLLCSAAVGLAIAALPRAFDRYWWLELLAGTVVLAGCLAIFERQIVRRVIRGLLARHAG